MQWPFRTNTTVDFWSSLKAFLQSPFAGRKKKKKKKWIELASYCRKYLALWRWRWWWRTVTIFWGWCSPYCGALKTSFIWEDICSGEAINCCNRLQDTRCSICTGQAQLTHSRHPRVSRFLGVNKNCIVHTEATIISICMLNSWSRRWKHCTTEVQSPLTFLCWRSVSTIIISSCQDITSRVSPLLGCPHFTTLKNKTNLKTQSFLRLKNTVW